MEIRVEKMEEVIAAESAAYYVGYAVGVAVKALYNLLK